MSGAALGLALGAAILHALWNLLLAGSRDVLAATAVALGASLVVAAPFAVVTWEIEREAIPWLFASAALELVYFFTLTPPTAAPSSRSSIRSPAVGRPYSSCSACSPPASSRPVGDRRCARGRGGRRLGSRVQGGDRLGVLLGPLIATQIAAYTLVDAEGIQHANPVPYLLLALIPAAVGAALASGCGRLHRELRAKAVLAGCGGFLAYVLVLAALQLAPAAPVAAVREASVLFAVALAAPILGERVTPARLAGAVLVVAGIVALGVG